MTSNCREFLREFLGSKETKSSAAAAHFEGCTFCAQRLRARDAMMPALMRREPLPGDPRHVMAAIHSRIVEQAESSPIGEWLEAGVPVAMPTAVSDAGADVRWPERLLETEPGVLDAREIVRADPPSPSPISWARVRGQILARVAAESVGSARRRWMLGVAGAAAVAIVLLVNVRSDQVEPTIVFRDLNASELASLGSFEFVVVRHGVTR